MTIDEAIAYAREKAKYKKTKYDKCPTRMRYCCEMCFHKPKCNEVAKEHKQLAEWLEELKELREKNETLKALYEDVRKEGNNLLKRERNKAIDDLIAECENAKFAESDEISLSDVHTGVNSGLSMAIHFAEQLKVGGVNGKERS